MAVFDFKCLHKLAYRLKIFNTLKHVFVFTSLTKLDDFSRDFTNM